MAESGDLLENINDLADGLMKRHKRPKDAVTVCCNALGALVAQMKIGTREDYHKIYDDAVEQGRKVLNDCLDEHGPA